MKIDSQVDPMDYMAIFCACHPESWVDVLDTLLIDGLRLSYVHPHPNEAWVFEGADLTENAKVDTGPCL